MEANKLVNRVAIEIHPYE